MKKSKFIFFIIFVMFLVLPIEVSAMQIFVKKPDTSTLNLEVESSDTIEAVKNKIYQIDNNFLVAKQKLIFDGKILQDGRTLADYNIVVGNTIELDLKYKVILDANGGKFNSLDQYVIDDWDYTMYDSLVKPTKDGYKFKGYFTERTSGTKFEMILNESGIDRNMTFYAQWEEIIEENPKTFDGIGYNVIMAIISIVGLVSVIVYLNVKSKIRL